VEWQVNRFCELLGAPEPTLLAALRRDFRLKRVGDLRAVRRVLSSKQAYRAHGWGEAGHSVEAGSDSDLAVE
jgi:hypothetical protein